MSTRRCWTCTLRMIGVMLRFVSAVDFAFLNWTSDDHHSHWRSHSWVDGVRTKVFFCYRLVFSAFLLFNLSCFGWCLLRLAFVGYLKVHGVHTVVDNFGFVRCFLLGFDLVIPLARSFPMVRARVEDRPIVWYLR